MKYLESLEPRDLRGTAAPVAVLSLGSSAHRLPLLDRAMEPAPMIEDDAGVDPVRATGRTDRRLWLAIVSGIAVIGFGFAGHSGTQPPAGAASVEWTTHPPIGQGAAPIPAAVLAPSVLDPAENNPSEDEVAAVLEVTSTTMAGSASIRLRRSAASERSEGDTGLLVDGHAPPGVETVTIDIRTLSGSLLASAVVPTIGDERPGSQGLPRVGVGSLWWELVVPGPIPADGWQVEITWRDGSNGSLGLVVQRIPAVNLGRNLTPFQPSKSDPRDGVRLRRRPAPSQGHGP